MKAIEEASLSLAWLRAAEYLIGTPKGKDVNLVVAFTTIDEEPAVRAVLDAFLERIAPTKPRAKVMAVETVASTLFPESWYVPERAPSPREHLYRCRDRAAKVHRRLTGPREFETYFDRLAAYPGPDGPVNQLEDQICRLQRELAGPGPKSSAYELGVSEPGDLRIQVPGKDRLVMGFPCLSHVSLTLHAKAVHLTALYRNQGFLRKAYGNYVGLARLARFFGREVGVEVGEITCVASHADMEFEVAGKSVLRQLVSDCHEVLGTAGPLREVDRAA
jgi:hypothetical protein